MPSGHLGEVYSLFQLQLGAHEHTKQAALRSTVEFHVRIGLPEPAAKVKDQRKYILEQFNLLSDQIKRQTFIDLVAAFEADLFSCLKEASGKVRHVLNQHYHRDYPFFIHRRHLAVTIEDVKSLGGYRHLIGGGRDAAERDAGKALAEVIAQRNYLAHGRRWEPPAIPPTIETAFNVLKAELDRVAGSSAGTM